MKIILSGPPQKKRAIDFIDSLNYDPKWVVECKRYRDSKTLPQLRTIHLWIHEARTFFGETSGKYFTDDALKDWVKGLFGIVEIYDTPAGKRKRYKSFADYEMDEMRQLMDDFQNYCASELSLFLTIPDAPEE